METKRPPPDAHTLVLVGNAGPAMWSAFRARVSEEMRGATIHPLDTWVREVIASVAARFQERTVR